MLKKKETEPHQALHYRLGHGFPSKISVEHKLGSSGIVLGKNRLQCGVDLAELKYSIC